MPPTISLSPISLSFTATQCESNPASQTVSVTNTGGGTLNWTASDDATWLNLSPTSGTALYLLLLYQLTNLAYLRILTMLPITVSASGATNTPQTVPVTLTINPPPVTTSTTSTSSSTTSTTTSIPTTTTSSTTSSTTTTTSIAPVTTTSSTTSTTSTTSSTTTSIPTTTTTTTVPQTTTIPQTTTTILTTTTTVPQTTTTTIVPRIVAFIQPTAISVGEKARITASSTDPVDTLSFTSSNPKVATVDPQGVVTGIAPGTATITITGSRSGATSIITVTVLTPPLVDTPKPPVVGIAPDIVQVGFQFTRLTLSAISGGKITFGATVAGGEGTVRVEVFYTTQASLVDPLLKA